ncbi:hypothetical protein CLV63_12910 [Murinocardiopsis flavida]|uniref:Uncharacterized protein n=1 Tax=Murinocardiopsis flavida TaxID=645275 RepID=A0A2P8CUS4_9ACTN|nr:hypothetical protein CLV63_12910 [Murinocardiopsis flavida]
MEHTWASDPALVRHREVWVRLDGRWRARVLTTQRRTRAGEWQVHITRIDTGTAGIYRYDPATITRRPPDAIPVDRRRAPPMTVPPRHPACWVRYRAQWAPAAVLAWGRTPVGWVVLTHVNAPDAVWPVRVAWHYDPRSIRPNRGRPPPGGGGAP